MKKLVAFVSSLAIAVAGFGLTAGPASANVFDTPPDNAIVSEGNGAAVFLGLGGDKQTSLFWRPTKKYDSERMLYQVQRSDGAIVVSKSSRTSYTDKQLKQNTKYGYTLTSYKQTKIEKGKNKGKYKTKRVGTNYIEVLTLPGNIQGLYSPGGRSLVWQPPFELSQPVQYNIYVNNNLWIERYEGTSYTFPAEVSMNKAPANSTVKIKAVNETGESRDAGLYPLYLG